MSNEARNESLWGYEEVAEYLGISPKTARKWANQRKLPVTKVGTLNRFRPSDIRRWAAERVQPPMQSE